MDESVQSLFTAFAIVWISYLIYALYLIRMRRKIRLDLKRLGENKYE